MRVTSERIRELTERYGKPFNLRTDYVMGRPRIVRPMGDGETNVSPRLRNAEMEQWLDGLHEGCKLENERIKHELQPLRERLEAWRDTAKMQWHRCIGGSSESLGWGNQVENYTKLIELLDKL